MIAGHQKQWNFLQGKLKSNQLAHAYLFTGAEQTGKKLFAKEFIKYINCLDRLSQPATTSSPAGEWCGGKCTSCQMIEKESFPDFEMVKPEDGKEIQIIKIRQIQNFLKYKSYYGSFKTVIIENADKMNQEAQGCFLKTLEEPKGKTLIILVTSKPDMLLPTIFSRCQTVKFFGRGSLTKEKSDEQNKILSELLGVLSGNLAEKFKYVKSLDADQNKLAKILEAMQNYFRYLLFIKSGVGAQGEQASLPKAPGFIQNYTLAKVKKNIRLIEDINNRLTFTNINPKIALEVLLMEM